MQADVELSQVPQMPQMPCMFQHVPSRGIAKPCNNSCLRRWRREDGTLRWHGADRLWRDLSDAGFCRTLFDPPRPMMAMRIPQIARLIPKSCCTIPVLTYRSSAETFTN